MFILFHITIANYSNFESFYYTYFIFEYELKVDKEFL